jgi:hypothetical protein
MTADRFGVDGHLAGQSFLCGQICCLCVLRAYASRIVAFEADQFGPATSSGWSVTVTGHAVLVTDPGAIARHQPVPLVPWAPGVRDQFVTITTELAEGLRVRRSSVS